MSQPPAAIQHRYEKLLEDAPLCMLATASSSGEPEAAVLAFAIAPEGLYFYTMNDSRKYPNLRQNPRVAMLLFHNGEYAQLNGDIEELAHDGAEAARAAILERSSGDLSQYHEDPRCRYFLFRPTRICLRIEADYPSRYETWHPGAPGEAKVKAL